MQGLSDARAIARGGAVNFSGSLAGAAATFLLLAVLARSLGVAKAGLFFQGVAVVSTFAIVCNFGSNVALMHGVARRLARGNGDIGRVVWAASMPVAISTVIIAVGLGLWNQSIAGILTDSANERSLAELLVAVAPALPLVALTRLAVSVCRGLGDMRPAALFDTGGQPLLRLLLCGIVALEAGHVWLLGAAFSIASAICFLFSLHTLNAALKGAGIGFVWRPSWDSETVRAFWKFSAPRGLEDIFAATNVWLLVALIGALATPIQAATFVAVSRFTLGSTLLMQAVTTSMAPRLTAAFAQREQLRVQTLFRTCTQWMVGASVPVCILLFIFPAALLQLVSPNLQGGETGLRVMAVAALFNVVTGPGGAAILFAGRSSWNLWIAIGALVAMLACVFVSVPLLGATGGCVAWACAMTVQSAAALMVARRAFDLSPFFDKVGVLATWSLGLSGAAALLARTFLGEDLLGMVTGASAMAISLLLYHSMTSWVWWRQASSPGEDETR